MNKKRLVIGIIGVATVLVVLGTTVAYFLTNPVDNNKEILTVNTGSLSLIFEDGNDGMQIKSLMLGESVTKEVKITNNGDLPVTTNLNWKDLTNTYLAKSLSYKVQYKTSESAGWADMPAEHTHVPQSASESEITILKDITIPAEGVYFYKITITFENTDDNQESDRNAMLATRFSLGDYFKGPSLSELAIKHLNITVNETTDTIPNFANPATTNEGVFSMEDDYGTSYYYRGAVTNNYVKFGGFYWRIIRINGDGSLRMIYDGTSYHANGESNADRYTKTGQVFNAKNSDAKYVGYMYGGSSKDAASISASDAQTNTYDSDIKTVVDEWYENNILTNAANSNGDISKYLADVIFCNDRTMPASGETWSDAYQDKTENLGWASHRTPYGSYHRFTTASNYSEPNPVPTFECSDNLTTGNKNNDRFTVNDRELGNGALKYPIGLITADEIVAAGSGKYNTANSAYYLYRGASSYTWSFSPNAYSGNFASVFGVGSNGSLSLVMSTSKPGASAPVINLKPEYATQLIGTGVENDEYRLEGVN